MSGLLRRVGTVSIGELSQVQGVRECLLWFTREKQWINEQHLQICRIPAPTFLEEQRAGWVAAQFKAIGCEAQIDRGGNVVAFLDPNGGDAPYVALTAHLDTVLAPRNKDEISVGPDGKFRGPGVSDNGAGLAALLAIAAALKSSPPLPDTRNRLVFIANVGEEGEGNLSGMRHVCKQSPLGKRIGTFVVMDGPATDHITCQALASQRFEVTFTGPGGHSWSDFGIGNPVHAISRMVNLYAEQLSTARNGASGPRTSFNFGLIEGGSSVNSIPAQARAKLDVRSESEEKMSELAALLTASVERSLEVENERCTGGKLTVKIRDIGARPGGQLPEDAPLLAYVRTVDQHLGIRSRVDCSSTDANIPLSLGIPAISIGAGGQGGGAHTWQEWFSAEGRALGLKRILLVISLLMRDRDLAFPAGE